MRSRVAAGLSWGVVGALAFLVLAQGRRLLGGGPGIPVLLGVALVVGALAAALAYVAGGWLAKRRL